jgi:2-dehydropantoate 2-reductase
VFVEASKIECTDDPSTVVVPVDWLIFTVKGFDTDSAALRVRAAPMVNDNTLILTFQNGVDNHIILGRHFNAGRVFGGVTYTPANVDAPGVVVHTGKIERYVWGPTCTTDPSTELRAAQFQAVLAASGIAVELAKDAEITMWSKLCTKAAFDAVSVLGRYDLGTMISHESTRELYASAMKEVFDVGLAKGVALDPGILPALQKYVFEEAAHGTRSSMLNDLEAGKRIEITELSGAVVRYGKEVGVPTPIHSIALAVLMPIQQKQSKGRL